VTKVVGYPLNLLKMAKMQHKHPLKATQIALETLLARCLHRYHTTLPDWRNTPPMVDTSRVSASPPLDAQLNLHTSIAPMQLRLAITHTIMITLIRCPGPSILHLGGILTPRARQSPRWHAMQKMQGSHMRS
jgi:hypothetical protein